MSCTFLLLFLFKLPIFFVIKTGECDCTTRASRTIQVDDNFYVIKNVRV